MLAFLFVTGCDPVGGDGDQYRMGEVIWSRDLADHDAPILNTTKPVIDGDVVYVVAGEELLSLTLADGTVRWKRSLWGPHFSRNMVHDAEALYLVDQGLVRAYNKHDGTLRWRASGAPIPTYLSVLTQTETHIYSSETDAKVWRIRKQDGKVDQTIDLTELQPEGDDDGQSPGILIPTDDDYLYVPTGYYVPGASAIGGNVLAYDAATGDYRWGYEVPTRRVAVPDYPGTYWIQAAGAEEGFVWGSYVIIQASTSVIGLDRFSGELR